MKKIQLFALFSALTVMGLASCQPAETSPEKQETAKGHSVIFNVQVKPEAETKTALSLEIVPDWRYTDTDDIHIFETNSVDNKILKASDVDIFTEDNDRKAYFHAFFEDIGFIINPSGVLTKAASTTYNYTALMSTAEIEGDNIKFVVPNVQYPNSNATIDPKADFLIGNCATTYNSWIEPDQRLDLKFIRPVAITRFSIFNVDGSKIESIKFTSEDFLTGYTTYDKVDFDDFTAEFSGDEADKTLTMVYPGGKNKSSLFTVYTITLPGEKRIKSIEIRTDTHVLTKSYATPAKLNFVKDMLREVSLDMSTATKTALLDQEMQFKDGNGDPVEEMTYDLVANEGSIDNFVSPTFSRGSECQTTVSFASDNEAVATVDADGNIKLTGAAGVAVITASADGDAAHKAGKATVTITVVTPEITFYKANAIDADVEYLIVANGKAVKYTATGMGFEDVTVDEGTITIDNSLLEGLLWKAAAISSTSEFITYGTHTFACGDNMLMRESDGNGTMALATSDAAMSKYMAWNYNGTNFWNHSINGENINDFYLTYDTTDGWIFEYQTTPTAVLFTTLKPREIAFETASYTYDRYTDDNFVAPTIEGATYTSSDPDIAEVDPATGAVTIEGGKTKTGTVTITATVAAGNGFQGASASYTIVVGDSEPAPIGKTLTMLLEPATELVAGEEYFLVSNGKVLARDGSDAVAADFDATEVAALVPSELVDNVAWTLQSDKTIFKNGDYFCSIIQDKNGGSDYQYTVGMSTVSAGIDGTSGNNEKLMPSLTIELSNDFVYFSGTNSAYFLYYDLTENEWTRYKTNKADSYSHDYKTSLYVRKDTRDEQTVEFVDADSNPVTTVTFDLANGADNFVAPTLSGTTHGEVTYSTDDTHGVITLDETTGAVTINKKGGPVTITANVAGDDDYKPATASYTLTVTNSNAKESVYNKVTSVSDLEVGAKYLIVFEGLANDEDDGDPKVFEAKVDGSELSKDAGHDVTIDNGVITSDLFDEYTFTLEEGYYLKADNVNKYMYPMQKSGTGGAFGAENSATNKLTITFSNGIASIACNSRYVVWSTSSHYFSVNNSTSSNSATGICLYKLYDGRTPQTLSFSSSEAKYDIANSEWTVEVPTLSGAYTDVTFSSSDESVATVTKVDNTTVTVTIASGAKKNDVAIITATAAGDDTYKPAKASFTVVVDDSNSVTPEYALVESSADIEVGAKYLLVNESNNKVFKPLLSSSNSTSFTASSSNALSATIENHTIVSDEFGDCELTLEDGYYFNVEALDRYLYPTSSSIGAESTPSSSHSFSVSISSGVADISRVSNNTTYRLRWTSQGYFQSSSSSANCQLYKLQDARQPQYIAFVNDAAEYDVYTSKWTVEVPALDITGVATSVVYESLNEDVATVDSNTGVVTIAAGAKNNDTAVISAIAVADASYKKATATYTITIVDSAPKNRNLAFTPSEVSVNIYGETLPYAFAGAPTLSGKTDGVTYSVSCSDTEIAIDDYPTVSNTGAVTIVSDVEGVFTITASAAATDALQAGEASYTLTVTNDAPPTYTKVSEITSGATYLIVSTDANNYNGLGQKRAFAGTTSGSVVEVDGTSGTITGDFSACEFVITSEGDATYSLKGPEGYVTGNSTVADPYIQVSSSKVTVTLTDAATLNAATSTDGLVSDAFYFYYLKNSSKEVLYLTKTTSGAINFKMGGSGRKYGVYLYKKN